MSGPRIWKPGVNHSIEKNREIGAQNRGTELEEISLKSLLICSSATFHGSDGLKNARRGEQVAERRQNGVDRRLPRDVIKSRGVRGKGAKVEGGGRMRAEGGSVWNKGICTRKR